MCSHSKRNEWMNEWVTTTFFLVLALCVFPPLLLILFSRYRKIARRKKEKSNRHRRHVKRQRNQKKRMYRISLIVFQSYTYDDRRQTQDPSSFRVSDRSSQLKQWPLNIHVFVRLILFFISFGHIWFDFQRISSVQQHRLHDQMYPVSLKEETEIFCLNRISCLARTLCFLLSWIREVSKWVNTHLQNTCEIIPGVTQTVFTLFLTYIRSIA